MEIRLSASEVEDWEDLSKRAPERRAKRYEVDFRVWLNLPASKGGSRQSGRATDIAELGIGVYVATELEAGHVVTVEFAPPGCTQLLQVKAIIRRRHGFHYGLEFLEMSSSQKETIARSCVALELA